MSWSPDSLIVQLMQENFMRNCVKHFAQLKAMQCSIYLELSFMSTQWRQVAREWHYDFVKIRTENYMKRHALEKNLSKRLSISFSSTFER